MIILPKNFITKLFIRFSQFLRAHDLNICIVTIYFRNCFRKYYFTLFCDYVSKILTGAAVRRCLTNFPKMFTKFTRKYCNEVLLATTTLTIQDSMSVVFQNNSSAEHQRRIQNHVKHLRWSDLRK